MLAEAIESGPAPVTSNEVVNLNLLINPTASMTTQHILQVSAAQTVESYGLQFSFDSPIYGDLGITINSGPNVMAPTTVGSCYCGGGGAVEFPVELGSAVPNVGDTYSLTAEYYRAPDWRFPDDMSTSVSGVVDAFATNLSPGAGMAAVANPEFTWSYPANSANYNYRFSIEDSNGNLIWQIPAANTGIQGFPSSINTITWGVDPNNPANQPTVASLTPGASYTWSIATLDANGNAAMVETSF
jgi:hypothetical protein